MLNPIAQLPQDCVWDIQWVLGYKINANSFGTHQTHHQFNPIDQSFGRFVEQKVGFVKEKNQFGFIGVANFGQLLKQLREHPQQKGSVQPRGRQQFVCSQNIDDALVVSGLHKVLNIEHRLTAKLVTALLLNL